MGSITVDTKLHGLGYWKDILGGRYENLCEILIQEYGKDYDKYEYTAREVFCYIIEYEGGCYGNYALSLLHQLTGIKIN